MNQDKIIERIDQLLKLGQQVSSTARTAGHLGGYTFVDEGQIKGFRSAALSFIELLYSSSHTHYKEFDKSVDKNDIGSLNSGISILKAIRSEVESGWLDTIKGLISAEIFADFIEMAEHLLENNYKDPAAVIAGSVLEEHLRQLCFSNGIYTEIEPEKDIKIKKADRLNSDLAKHEVYNKLDQKAITSWLDLRNKAAHGKYDEYTKEQVSLMLQGIIDFMTRIPV
jgi:hypothetical protein